MELLTLIQADFGVDCKVWKTEANYGLDEEGYVEKGIHLEQCAHKRSPRHLQGLLPHLPGNLEAMIQYERRKIAKVSRIATLTHPNIGTFLRRLLCLGSGRLQTDLRPHFANADTVCSQLSTLWADLDSS